MYYAYILRSKKFPGAIYKGYTQDLKLRMTQHNSATEKYSSKYSVSLVIKVKKYLYKI